MIALWGEAVRSVEAFVKPAHRDHWLRPIQCVAISDGRILLRAPNRYHKEWFEDHYLPPILSDLQNRTQSTFTVEFEIRDERQAPAVAEARQDTARITEAEPAPELPRGLEPRYTFDRYVVGPTNQFPHAAARMVADAPASKWNPLFIYGGAGLGKTHLLNAIGHDIRRQQPKWNITFVTCESFVTEFIGSMMNQRRMGGVNLMEQFRARYRDEPDVLLIDDVQFLSHKDSSQDEFFYTFDALHRAHKQIVLTCDKLPGELAGLEQRLRSRFTWGLIAEIGNPDLETRIAILKRKAEADAVALADDVAVFIAAHIKSNVRELEGALLHVCARAQLAGVAVTKELAEETLRSLIASTPAGLTIEAIQREVAAYFDVKLQDLKGPKRHRAVAHPRMVAMYLARRLTAMSYPEIGSRFGGKDHSTVISAVRKIERLAGEDPSLRSIVTTLESHLRSG